MEIVIKQEKISVGRDKYNIFIDGEKKYRAATPLLNITNLKVTMFKLDSDEPIISCEIGSLFKKDDPYFFIERQDKKYKFNTIDLVGEHYQCEVENDMYDIYGHTGLKYSVFKNNTQIAWWTSKRFKLLKGDKFTITCNNNCDIELLSIFCLLFDLGDATADYSFDVKATKVVFNGKKFDENWKPV